MEEIRLIHVQPLPRNKVDQPNINRPVRDRDRDQYTFVSDVFHIWISLICIMHTIDAPISQPMPRAKPTRPKTRTPESDRLFLLLGLGTLDLGRTTQSLLAVLALLACSPEESVLLDQQEGDVSRDGENVRCCRDARSGLTARPTRTNLYWGSNFFMASGES